MLLIHVFRKKILIIKFLHSHWSVWILINWNFDNKSRFQWFFVSVKSTIRQLERQITLKNHVDTKEHSTKESFPEVDGPWQNLPRNASQFSKKVMIKYKEQTNKIVSQFRPPHVNVTIKHIGRWGFNYPVIYGPN